MKSCCSIVLSGMQRGAAECHLQAGQQRQLLGTADSVWWWSSPPPALSTEQSSPSVKTWRGRLPKAEREITAIAKGLWPIRVEGSHVQASST